MKFQVGVNGGQTIAVNIGNVSHDGGSGGTIFSELAVSTDYFGYFGYH